MKRKEKATSSPDLSVTKQKGAEVKMGKAKKSKSKTRNGVATPPAAETFPEHEDAEKVLTGQGSEDLHAAEARAKKRKKRKASSEGVSPGKTDFPAAKLEGSAEKLSELPEQDAPATQPDSEVAPKARKKRKYKRARGPAADSAVALPDERPPPAVDSLSQPAHLATDGPSLAGKKKKRHPNTSALSAPAAETEQQPVETGDVGHASPVLPAATVADGSTMTGSKKKMRCMKQLPRTEAPRTPDTETDQQHAGTDNTGNVNLSEHVGMMVESSTSMEKKKKRKKGAPKMRAPPTPDAGAEKAETEGIGNELESKAVQAPAPIKSGSAAKSFQRVKPEEWTGKQGAWDNSYRATFGEGGWGAKAEAVLGQVRGKDFRHEKTKKKRGSYRGGVIDNNVNSFKFESDDE